MKKSKLLFVNLLSCVILLIAVAFFSTPVYAFAQNNNIDNVSVNEQTTNTNVSQVRSGQDVQDIFNDKKIVLCETLYNLDDAEDYIYVEFETGGYAILLNETMELLEYSVHGKPIYFSKNVKKYYGGPCSYLFKEDNTFIDIMTEKKVNINVESAKEYANLIRENLFSNSKKLCSKIDLSNIDLNMQITTDSNSGLTPSFDQNSLIKDLNICDGNYIENYNYFLFNPKHGNNSTGTCGAVAAQLLLSYNNFYSDRRIIENKYLNGSNSADEKNMNPNYCEDPMSMTTYTLGSRGYKEDGTDIENSYFAYTVNNIPANATTAQVKNGINNILNERNSQLSTKINYTLNSKEGRWLFGNRPVDSTGIKAEIDAGRPTILLLQKSLGGADHYVVAYGYQNYTYPNTTNSYLGFITHFGWNKNYLNIWVNSSWCYSYISLEINHTHEYTYNVGYNDNLCIKETKCGDCGHRTDTVVELRGSEKLTELVSDLSQSGGYKDYFVTFLVAGSKLIQTFGREDVKISLYDENNNLLVYDDNSGYELNAFIRINAEIDKKYRLRVEYSGASNSGKVKTVISPTNVLYQWYDKWIYSGAEHSHYSYVFKNQNDGFVYNPPESGTYTIRTVWKEENAEESVREPYIHIIDPISTEKSLSDCLSGGNRQALITAQLVKGRLYFIVISSCNIVNDEGGITTLIQKIS